MIKKVWKGFFYSFIFFFCVIMLLTVFVNYKLKGELNNYLVTVDKINQLNDTYIICQGLTVQNPTKENRQMCQEIKKDLNKKYGILKEKYPFMNLYNKFVRN